MKVLGVAVLMLASVFGVLAAVQKSSTELGLSHLVLNTPSADGARGRQPKVWRGIKWQTLKILDKEQ